MPPAGVIGFADPDTDSALRLPSNWHVPAATDVGATTGEVDLRGTAGLGATAAELVAFISGVCAERAPGALIVPSTASATTTIANWTEKRECRRAGRAVDSPAARAPGSRIDVSGTSRCWQFSFVMEACGRGAVAWSSDLEPNLTLGGLKWCSP